MNGHLVNNALEDARWQRLACGKTAGLFLSPPWLQVIHESYGFAIQAALLEDGDGIPLAGVPFCDIHDPRGRRRITLPYSDYCDPVAATPAEWALLADLLLETDATVRLRCVHNPFPAQDARMAQVNRAHWHGIDLAPDLETLWTDLPGSARRAIRKSERQGITIRPAQDEADLHAFFAMHLAVRKQKYAMLAQPYPFFQAIWRNFIEPGQGALLLAEQESTVVGATFYLIWNGTLYYKFNASNPGALDARPNDLLVWEGIRLAKERGLTFFDFGLSDWGQEGLVRFKQKYAGQEKTITFLQRDGAAPPETAQQFTALLPQLTDLFTQAEVPDSVTAEAGSLLYRFFV